MFENATSFRNYIKRKSNDLNIDINYGYQNYLLQSFALKVSKTKYKDEFIYKGGFMLSNIIGIETRTTMDIDVTVKSKIYTYKQICTIFENICSVEIDCPFVYSVDHISEEMNSKDEPGYKIVLLASFDSLRFYVKIDVSCGSFIYPKDINYILKGTMLDKNIDVLSYPIENIIAEKFETLIDRGTTNGRMRDFYDLYVLLSCDYKYDINRDSLIKTLHEVSKNRNTLEVMNNSLKILDDVESSSDFNKYWTIYINDINRNALNIDTKLLFKLLRNLADEYLAKYKY